MRIFKGLQKDEIGEQCECCERRVGVEDQSTQFCYDNMKLAGLGSGVPLFFAFIKNSIIFLVLLGITFVGFALYSNIDSGYCSTLHNCSDNFLDSFSIFNKTQNDSFLAIQNYTVLAFCFLAVLALQYFRYNFRKIEEQCDGMINTPSDYAIILRRLPDGTTKRDIESMIENKRIGLSEQEIKKTDNLKIDHIVMSFSMTEYNKIKQQNFQQFTKLLSESKHQQFKPKLLPKLHQPASLAIVIFSKQQSKQFFKYKSNILQNILQCFVSVCVPLSQFQVKGQRIAVERAPEPDDIIWENSKISMGGAIIRKLIYNSLAILLLSFGYGVQYGLAIAKTKISQDSTTQLIMSTLISITIFIINLVIQLFFQITSKKQRTETLTEFNNILMVKISVFQFLNTGVFVILAQFMANMDNFSLNGGIVFQITQVMLLNAIAPNISLFVLSYFQILKKIQRYLIRQEFIKRSQMESNIAFQGPQAEFPFKYAYVFKTLWLSAFYASISPVIVPISIFGLLINYFLEKFLFGHSYATPNTISSIINDSAVEMMEYAVLGLPVGSYIIYLYFYSFSPDKLPDYWSIPIYISIGIAVLNLILPMDTLNKKLFKMKNDGKSSPLYEEVESKFEVTYEMTNPGYVCKRKRKRDLFAMSQISQHDEIPLHDITGVRILGNNNLENPLVEQQDQIYDNAESNEVSMTNRVKENSFFKSSSNTTRNTEDFVSHQSFTNSFNKIGESQTLQGIPPKFQYNQPQKDNDISISLISQNASKQIVSETFICNGTGNDNNGDEGNLVCGTGQKILPKQLTSNLIEQSQIVNQDAQMMGIIEQRQTKLKNENKSNGIGDDIQIRNGNEQICDSKDDGEANADKISEEHEKQLHKEMQQNLMQRSEEASQQQEMQNATYSEIIQQEKENKSLFIEKPNSFDQSFSYNSCKIEKQKISTSFLRFKSINSILQEEYSEASGSVQQTQQKQNDKNGFLLVEENGIEYPNQFMPIPTAYLLSKQAFQQICRKQDGASQQNEIKNDNKQPIETSNKSGKNKKSFFPSKFKQFFWKPPSENVDVDFNKQVHPKQQFQSLFNANHPKPISICQQSSDYSNSRQRRKALRMQNMKKFQLTKMFFKQY